MANKKTIMIDEEYYIEADDLNWTLFHQHEITEKGLQMLERRGVEAKNTTSTDTLGYYSNFREAVNGYIKHKKLSDPRQYFNNLQGYCTFVEKCDKEAVDNITKLLSMER